MCCLRCARLCAPTIDQSQPEVNLPALPPQNGESVEEAKEYGALEQHKVCHPEARQGAPSGPVCAGA